MSILMWLIEVRQALSRSFLSFLRTHAPKLVRISNGSAKVSRGTTARSLDTQEPPYIGLSKAGSSKEETLAK